MSERRGAQGRGGGGRWGALAAGAAVLLVAVVASAQAVGRGAAMTTAVEQVVVVERAWPPLVQIVVQIPSGALQDPDAAVGRAGVCWDAAVRAAGGLDHVAFSAALDALGARLTVDVGQSVTRLQISGLVEGADAMAALLADVLFRPGLAVADVDEARALRLAALQDKDDDDGALAGDALVRYALRGSPLGRPVDGTPQGVARVDVTACRAALAAAHQGRGAWVGVAGALPRADALDLARKHFGKLLALPAQAPALPAPPPADGRRLLLIDHPGQPSAQIALALRSLGARDGHAAAWVVGDAIVGGAFTSRLSQQVRELRGWTYSIQSQWVAGPSHGLWLLQWAPRNAVAVRSLDLVLRQLELAASDGATAAEVTFAKEHLRGSQRLALETAGARLSARLGALTLGLPAAWVDGFEERLRAVDRKAVSAAMARGFAAHDVVVVVVGDASKLRPALEKASSGFAIEVLTPGQAPEATRQPGRRPGQVAAPVPSPGPPEDDGDEEHGPAFDERGEIVDPPPAATPSAVDGPEDDPDDAPAAPEGGADDEPPPSPPPDAASGRAAGPRQGRSR